MSRSLFLIFGLVFATFLQASQASSEREKALLELRSKADLGFFQSDLVDLFVKQTEGKNCEACLELSTGDINKNLTQMCEVIAKSPVCAALQEEEKLNCQQLDDSYKIDAVTLLGGCSAGLFDFVKETITAVWSMMKGVWDTVTNPSESATEARKVLDASYLYLIDRYEDALEIESEPFRKIKAASHVAQSLGNDLVAALSSYLENEYESYQCMNSAAKTRMICKIAPVVLTSAASAVALLAKGGKAAVKLIGKKLDGQKFSKADISGGKDKTNSDVLRELSGSPQDVLIRTSMAEKSLGRDISLDQAEMVEKAHLVGMGLPGKDGTLAKIGNYTVAQIAEKNRILKDAGFSVQDRRKLLEDGVAGIAGNNVTKFGDELSRRERNRLNRELEILFGVNRAKKETMESKAVWSQAYPDESKVDVADVVDGVTTDVGSGIIDGELPIRWSGAEVSEQPIIKPQIAFVRDISKEGKDSQTMKEKVALSRINVNSVIERLKQSGGKSTLGELEARRLNLFFNTDEFKAGGRITAEQLSNRLTKHQEGRREIKSDAIDTRKKKLGADDDFVFSETAIAYRRHFVNYVTGDRNNNRALMQLYAKVIERSEGGEKSYRINDQESQFLRSLTGKKRGFEAGSVVDTKALEEVFIGLNHKLILKDIGKAVKPLDGIDTESVLQAGVEIFIKNLRSEDYRQKVLDDQYSLSTLLQYNAKKAVREASGVGRWMDILRAGYVDINEFNRMNPEVKPSPEKLAEFSLQRRPPQDGAYELILSRRQKQFENLPKIKSLLLDRDSVDKVKELDDYGNVVAMEDALLVNRLLDHGSDPGLIFEQIKGGEILNKTFGTLTRSEREVLLRTYGIGRNQEETRSQIAESLGVTEGRVKKIHDKAVRKLRHPSRSEDFSDLITD